MPDSILAIIIVAITIVLFISEKIPMAITATMAALAMGITGIIDISAIYKNFGSMPVVMVGSMMIIGDCVFQCGLAGVVGKKLTSLGLGGDERMLIIVMTGFAMLTSAFFSNSAVVAMLIPLLASIVAESGGKVQNKNALMAVGMGASAGGFCTMAGCTPQLVTQDFLITQGLKPMAFFDLAKAGVPMCLLMLAYFATVGYALEKKVFNFPDIIPGQTDPNAQAGDAPRWKMILTGIVVLLCIGGFISGIWDLAVVSLIGVCVLALTGCIDLRKSLRDVDWNTLIIIAMSQSFAKGLESSGASTLIAEQMLRVFGGDQASPYLVLIILMVVTIALTNFMSNVAAVSMMLPIGVQSAIALGARPESFAIALTIGSMMGTATPVGTACVTQTLVGGYRYMDYVKIGFPITAAQTVLGLLLVPLVYGI